MLRSTCLGKLTSTKRLRWQREIAREERDYYKWRANEIASWKTKKQAQAHAHFFFLKGCLADVQINGPRWLFTTDDYKVAHLVLRRSLQAEEYHNCPDKEKIKWLEKKMYEARTGESHLSGPNVT